jgi:PAS domain S-box-containing protein
MAPSAAGTHAKAVQSSSATRSAVTLARVLAVAVTMAIQYAFLDRNGTLPPPVRYLAILPVLVAAYGPHGLGAALATTGFFSSAYLVYLVTTTPATMLAGGLIDLAFYTLFLAIVAYLASTIATSLQSRSALVDAVADRQALLARAADLDEVIAFVLQDATFTVDAQAAVLLLRSPLDDQWELVTFDQGQPQHVTLGPHPQPLTLAHWLVDRGSPQLLNDVDDDPRFDTGLASLVPVHSLLVQPLHRGDGTLTALLAVLDKRNASFSFDDQQALSDLLLGSEAALEQAAIYTRTDQALARRIHQLGIIQRTAQALNSTLDPAQIVHETLASMLDLAGAEAGLVCVDRHGPDLTWEARGMESSTATVTQLLVGARQLPRPLLNPARDVALSSTLPLAGSRIVVPIRHARHTLGVLVVESPRPAAFGQDVLRTVTALADHVAIALENAQLFEEIRHEREKANQIIKTMADGLLTTGADGRITVVNPAAAVLLNRPAPDVVGLPICEIMGCRDGSGPRHDCILRSVLETGQAVSEARWVLRQPRGMQHVLAVSAVPLPRTSSDEGGMVVLLRDVTQRDALERAQRELVAAFSHELRTPLANMTAIIELLLQDPERTVGERQRAYFGALLAQSRRLADFAERTLDVSRLDAGQWALEMRPLPIGFVIEETVGQWQAQVPDHTWRVELPATPSMVWADEYALAIVLNTLIDNALKYAAMDSQTVLHIEEGDDWMTVTVSDHGPGIAPEHQARIFDRFYRVDASDAQPVYGHGLGLYLARRLVQAMGGDIWVTSELGQGSHFSFTIPQLRANHGGLAKEPAVDKKIE